MLALDGLTCRFGENVAVHSVSLEFEQGAFVGIIGRSGAGKSTLLRAINRLVDPAAGRISYRGADITALRGADLRTWRARAAMIFQQFNLVPRLDVLTNVMLGRIARHRTLPSLLSLFSQAERGLAVEALERVDLLPFAFQRTDTLSGGQQQRVAIARALMQEPAILLADEPVASLDPRNAQHVMNHIQAINREDGITVLCNLHSLDLAREYCNRVVGMARGRVVFDGTPAELTSAAIREIYQTGDDDVSPAEEVAAAAAAAAAWQPSPQPVGAVSAA
jgi:phosphonate transport system ATP-binding protein